MSALEDARNNLLAALEFLDSVIIVDGIADSVSNAAACCAQVGGSMGTVAGELAVAEEKLTQASNIIGTTVLEIRGQLEWITRLLE